MHLTAWAAEVWDGQSQRKGPAYLGQQDAICLYDQHGLVSSVKINVSLAQAKWATETQKRDGQYEGRELTEGGILVWRTIDWGGEQLAVDHFSHVSNISCLDPHIK